MTHCTQVWGVCSHGDDELQAKWELWERKKEKVDLHTRHESSRQRDGTDWKPFIHSFRSLLYIYIESTQALTFLLFYILLRITEFATTESECNSSSYIYILYVFTLHLFLHKSGACYLRLYLYTIVGIYIYTFISEHTITFHYSPLNIIIYSINYFNAT